MKTVKLHIKVRNGEIMNALVITSVVLYFLAVHVKYTPCLPSDEPTVKKADETNSEPANIDVGDTNGAPFTNDDTPEKIIASDGEKKDVVNGEPVEKDEVITEVKQDGKNEDVLAVENSQENVVNEGGVKGEGTAEKKGEIESMDKGAASPSESPDVLPPPIEPDMDHIKVKEENIPSFDEWKQQMLAAAEEEKEKTKHLGAQVVQTNGAQGNKQKTNKNRPNLAANSCGAKVISLNQEAQNPSAVLSENKDQYMIQPCKAKKWFVVELCEPLQVETLEIGNLELFSSLPESFLVQISDRYPTKEWKTLGTFHARDVRSIQTFTVDDDHYAKYVRIEILSHFGTEHYCPLTVLRVFGSTVHEEEDYADEDEHIVVDVDTVTDGAKAVEDKPTNLFNTAIDTVSSMIKDVLGKEEEEENTEKLVDKDIVNPKPGNTTELNKTLPCPPTASDGREGTGTTVQGGVPFNQPEVPGVPIFPSPVLDFPCEDVSRSVKHTCGEPTSFLYNLKQQCRMCYPIVVDGHLNVKLNRTSVCGYFRVLVDMEPICCIPCGKSHLPLNKPKGFPNPQPLKTDKVQETPSSETVVQEISTVDKANAITSSEQDQVIHSSQTQSELHSQVESPSEINPTKSESVIQNTQVVNSDSDVNEGVVVDNGAKNGDQLRSSLPSVDNVGESSSTKVHVATEALESSSVTLDHVASDNVAQPEGSTTSTVAQNARTCDTNSNGDCKMGPDVSQIRPTKLKDPVIVPPYTKSDTDTNKTPPEKQPTKDQNSNIANSEKNLEQTAQENVNKHADETPPPAEKEEGQLVQVTETTQQKGGETKETGEMKKIYAQEPNDLDTDLVTVPPPTDDEVLIQKRLPGKETTYMKLKNKIKALELNLNLSSRYLEELSQKYRRQMEEMYTSLNFTINKLSNTAKSADERDARQQEKIASLQNQITDLTNAVENLTHMNANIHSEVVERHMYLMLIELAIFLVIIAWLLNKQQTLAHKLSQSQRVQTNHSTPLVSETLISEAQISLSPSNKNIGHRRNKSTDGTPSRMKALSAGRPYEESHLHRSGSEPDLTIVETNIPLFISPLKEKVPDQPKKKKKRKKEANSSNPQQQHQQQPRLSKQFSKGSQEKHRDDVHHLHLLNGKHSPSGKHSNPSSCNSSLSSLSTCSSNHSHQSAHSQTHKNPKKNLNKTFFGAANGGAHLNGFATNGELCNGHHVEDLSPWLHNSRGSDKRP